jgi:HD domain
MDIYEAYLNSPAKTEPPLTLFEHSSDVLQVLDYFISQNSTTVQRHDLIRAAALVHDVGKLAGDLSGGRWVHTSHSAEFLDNLLAHPRFRELLNLANIDLSRVDRGLLLKICERHHYQSPELLRSCKEAVLVGMADALASAIEAGAVGHVEEILRRSPYLQVSLELVRSLGFTGGLAAEVHYLDLPGQFIQDLILADMLFRLLAQDLRRAGIVAILQRGARLCIVGPMRALRDALNAFAFDPQYLYKSYFEDQIYDSILTQFPAGSMQIDILRYLLITEPAARSMAIALYTRDKPRQLLERHNLSQLIDEAPGIFSGGLSDGIDKLWQPIKSRLLELAPEFELPESLSLEVERVANGQLKRPQIGLFSKPQKEEARKGTKKNDKSLNKRASHNQRILESLVSDKDKKKIAADAEEFLKLFDASLNAFRSVTNILLESLKMRSELVAGTYTMRLSEAARLDMAPIQEATSSSNETLCPVCRRFLQQIRAPALITGRSEGDSSYYSPQKSREGAIHICRWCFIAGYMDLPLATFTREGNSVIKNGEYLILTTPMPVEKLRWLVDFVRRGRREETINEEERLEQTETSLEELKELEAMLGVGAGFDGLAVLGASRSRLANLKGFVLPSANLLANFVGIRIPFERIVGEDKVSGAVQRELVKATMHDLREITGAAAMHYMVFGESPFSVCGRPVDIEDMRRANVAYRIANRYARVGRYRQLNSGLFMLLLSNPRQAITRVFRTRRRQDGGRYVPGGQLIKEVIEMAEGIAQKDWKFDLGQRITSVLVEVDLLPKARSFWKSPQEKFSGVELTKWLQRLKMAHDESSIRQWGTQLINALKAGRVASREFKEGRGMQVGPPGEETVAKVLDLVENIITTCAEHKCKLSEFSRDIAEMDYYLLFYFNQKAKEAKP